MNKTAKEMFDELMFECSDLDFGKLYTHVSGTKIKFSLFDDGYTFGIPKDMPGIDEEKEFSLVVGTKIHNAIHQQMKEFGWLNNKKEKTMITKEQAVEAAAKYLETGKEEDARIVAEYMRENENEVQ